MFSSARLRLRASLPLGVGMLAAIPGITNAAQQQDDKASRYKPFGQPGFQLDGHVDQFRFVAAPSGTVPPAPSGGGHPIPATKAARAAMGSVPHDKPIAGHTEGAASDKVEAPEAEAEGAYKLFPRFPGAAKIPGIQGVKTTVPVVPPPAAVAVAKALAGDASKVGGGGGGGGPAGDMARFFRGGPGGGGASRPPPVRHLIHMNTTARSLQLSPSTTYPAWTYDDGVPGPVIRTRVGDWLEVHYKNEDATGNGHNIDFHSNTGPGGGAPATYAEPGDTRHALFKMTYPGLFVYHCAAAPLPAHVANGMYGAIIVDPLDGPLQSPPTLMSKEDLWGPDGPPAGPIPDVYPPGSSGGAAPVLPATTLRTPDGRPIREFCIVQSEFYSGSEDSEGLAAFDYPAGLAEKASHVVFNGREGALTERPLMAYAGDRVRIYFANAGPNAISSFHLIGTIFDAVWREGDFISPPGRGIQTVTVPAGGSCVVEVDLPMPGSFTLVDHAIFRTDKGAVGFLKVLPRPGAKGPGGKREDLYASAEPPVFCPGCKMHN